MYLCFNNANWQDLWQESLNINSSMATGQIQSGHEDCVIWLKAPEQVKTVSRLLVEIVLLFAVPKAMNSLSTFTKYLNVMH